VGESFDYQKREERIAKLRSAAIAEVWNAAGYDGILRLCERGEAGFVIGLRLAAGAIKHFDSAGFLSRLVSEHATRSSAQIDACISGFLVGTENDVREELLSNLIAIFDTEGSAGRDKILRLLKNAPFMKSTWRHVDRLGQDVQSRYWKEFTPSWGRLEPDELNEMVERLLEVNRPRAAMSTARFEFNRIESATLVRLLKEVATNGAEPPEHYRLQSHEIEEAFKALDERTDVSADELAHLGFLYLSALDHGERGIPNLERQIAETPALFMQAIALAYKRSDEGEDRPEWRIVNEEARTNIATQAYRLLHNVKRIPGTQDNGAINVPKLKAWIGEVQTLCKAYARVEVGDSVIGQLLSKGSMEFGLTKLCAKFLKKLARKEWRKAWRSDCTISGARILEVKVVPRSASLPQSIAAGQSGSRSMRHLLLGSWSGSQRVTTSTQNGMIRMRMCGGDWHSSNIIAGGCCSGMSAIASPGESGLPLFAGTEGLAERESAPDFP
jgi:hypothetical protein